MYPLSENIKFSTVRIILTICFWLGEHRSIYTAARITSNHWVCVASASSWLVRKVPGQLSSKHTFFIMFKIISILNEANVFRSRDNRSYEIWPTQRFFNYLLIILNCKTVNINILLSDLRFDYSSIKFIGIDPEYTTSNLDTLYFPNILFFSWL